MKKTMSLKGRSPSKPPRPEPSGELTAILEATLATELAAQPDCPVVRLKSTEGTYNAKGERVILIRRTPFAKMSEYEPALTRVCFKALRQWCNAGIGDLFPAEYREAAELDLIDMVHQDMRFKYKESRNAHLKHKDLVARLVEEIEPEYGREHIDYCRTDWAAYQAELELNRASAVEGMDRYQSLLTALTQGCIITQRGTLMVIQAMLLAMCDALPSAELTDLPDGGRHRLREAMETKDLVSEDLIQAFVSLPAGPWANEGSRTCIRQCAQQLLDRHQPAEA